jgi:Bifunctional DNA primase/polymerase, N-terminal
MRTVGGKTGQSKDDLERLYRLLGYPAVLLPLRKGSKAPDFKAWEKTTLKQNFGSVFRRMLADAVRRGGNIGVLLGPASGNLVALDIDADHQVEGFLELNPLLRYTLRTRGAKGCQLWLRMKSDYPARKANSHLKLGTGKPVAEWRAGGGCQSVIWGQHPAGTRYQFALVAPVRNIAFCEIVWPEHWGMRFCHAGAERTNTGQFPRPQGEQSLDDERVARITRYLATVPGAISGCGGSLVTFRLTSTLLWGFGLSAEQARAFLDLYNLRCQPPWSDAELEHKLADALKAKQSKPRGYLWDESREGTFTRMARR